MATVLIVDDDVGMSSLLAKLLKLSGYQAESVPSGEEAMAYLAGTTLPDAIILDIMMPGMSGFDVLRRMQAMSLMRKVPVIMFSAVSDRSYEKEARSLGAVDYWVKGSLDFDQLNTQLDRHILGRKPPGQISGGGGAMLCFV
jgi:putative two-component system response regulator